MKFLLNLFYPVIKAILSFCSDINWTPIKKAITGRAFDLTIEEQNIIKSKLVNNYYIMLLRRKTHLTTYLIELGELIKTGKLGYWSHTFCNIEDAVNAPDDYKLVEATKIGVHYSKFDDVFNCDSVVLLKPKNMLHEEYTKMLDDCLAQLGKPYDFILDVSDASRVSCVELIYQAILMNKSEDKFPSLIKMVTDLKNLTPDMLYTCGDFEIDYEVRH